MPKKAEISEKRQAQLRDAQRRRREKLAGSNRHQVNIYLTKKAMKLLDAQCLLTGLDRHELIEQLILQLQSVKAFPS
jgi:predicted restriction endonuclease